MADDSRNDYTRMLGVIEAITLVTQQCPSGSVRTCAEGALEAIRSGGADALREQAWIVLSAIRGWRGDRARQVHTSLSHFLETSRDQDAGD
jgi:hypothetical protein